MRRLDVLLYSMGVLGGGGLLYGVLQKLGTPQAGIAASTVLTLGLVGWVLSYFRRVLTGTMALKEQSQAFRIAALQEELEKLTPSERQALEEQLRDPELP